MSDTLAPTCVVLESSSCSLQKQQQQEYPENSQLVTTFSGADSTTTDTVVRPTTPITATGLVRSSSPSGSFQHQHQSVGVGAGSLPSNRNSQGAGSPNALRPGSPTCDSEEHDNEQPQVSSPKSPKSLRTAWKTSKFFSKSMTSGEIIRGLKKLSLSASSSSNNTSEEQPLGSTESTNGNNANKSFILRLANFKKRSSCGPEDLPQDTEVPTTAAQQTSKSHDASKPDEGIVCKKEDLKAIICNATRRLPLCSPRKKKALRQTKSASFEPPDDKTKKAPVRRAGSEESKTRRLAAESQTTPKAEKKVTNVPTPKEKPAVVFTPPQTEPVQLQQVVPVDQTTCVSKVKWDECDVVDAVLIGDAIESFLKGSMAYPEKDTKLFPKMAFRKNSFEKKS